MTSELDGAHERRTELLALGAALITVALWSSAFVGIRSAGSEFTAGPLTLGRLLVGTVVLGAAALTRGVTRPARGDVVPLLVCGLAWFGIYNIALNEAERRIDAGTASMLVNVGPILVAILAGTLLGEGFPRGLVLGCVVAFSGAIVIGLATSHDGLASGWGTALCVLAAFAYACAMVAQKPLLRRMSALDVTWLACTIGTIACLPFAPALLRELGHAQPSKIAWIVYLGAFPTAIAFTTWAYALARTPAGRLGSTTYLVPPIAIALAWAILAETPPLLAIGGGALCIAGAAIARRR